MGALAFGVCLDAQQRAQFVLSHAVNPSVAVIQLQNAALAFVEGAVAHEVKDMVVGLPVRCGPVQLSLDSLFVGLFAFEEDHLNARLIGYVLFDDAFFPRKIEWKGALRIGHHHEDAERRFEGARCGRVAGAEVTDDGRRFLLI